MPSNPHHAGDERHGEIIDCGISTGDGSLGPIYWAFRRHDRDILAGPGVATIQKRQTINTVRSLGHNVRLERMLYRCTLSGRPGHSLRHHVYRTSDGDSALRAIPR